MKVQMFCLAVAIAAGAVSAWPLAAEARIRCEGPFQVVPGQGNLATPYCEDEYLAQVARFRGGSSGATPTKRKRSAGRSATTAASTTSASSTSTTVRIATTTDAGVAQIPIQRGQAAALTARARWTQV